MFIHCASARGKGDRSHQPLNLSCHLLYTYTGTLYMYEITGSQVLDLWCMQLSVISICTLYLHSVANHGKVIKPKLVLRLIQKDKSQDFGGTWEKLCEKNCVWFLPDNKYFYEPELTRQAKHTQNPLCIMTSIHSQSKLSLYQTSLHIVRDCEIGYTYQHFSLEL